MTDTLDKHREALRAIAAEQDDARTLPERRTKAVAAARDAGMTWREASVILGMTTEGLRKAARPESLGTQPRRIAERQKRREES